MNTVGEGGATTGNSAVGADRLTYSPPNGDEVLPKGLADDGADSTSKKDDDVDKSVGEIETSPPPSPPPSPSHDVASPFKGIRELKSLLPSLLEDDWSLHFQGT